MNEDDNLIAAMTTELQRCKTPLEMVLHPVSAFQLVGLLQLALRHPDVNGPAGQTGRTFIQQVCLYFKAHEATAVLEVIRQGEDSLKG